MNWTILIEQRLLRRIQLWGRPYPALPGLVHQRLNDELATDPDAHLGRLIVPTTYRVYYMVFNGVPGIPDGLLCTFAVHRDDQARTLRIVGARMQTPRPGQP